MASPNTAGTAAGTYTWRGVVGAGTYQCPPFYQEIDFTSHGGTLTINYDPNNLDGSSIEVDTGIPSVVPVCLAQCVQAIG